MKLKAKIYIDGANIFYTQKDIGWIIDWKKVKKYLAQTWDIIEIRYYTGIKEKDQKITNYLRYLRCIGITTVTKPLKRIVTDKGFLFKSNFDVEMTTDILTDNIKHDDIILFTGDSDFHYLAKKLKNLGKRVVVFSSRKMLSWELKLTADQYVFIEDIKNKIVRR